MYKLVSKVLNIKKGVIKLLVLFSLCISILTLIIPIAVQTIVNTLAFSTLKQPLFILVLLVIFILILAGLIRVFQIMIVENIQQYFFTDIALRFAKLLPRLKFRELNAHRGPEIINRFFEVIPIQKTLSILLIYIIELVIQAITSFLLLAFYHPYLLVLDGILVISFIIVLVLPYSKAISSALNESDYKHKTVAWLEEYLHCPNLFKFNNNDNYLLNKVDINIKQYLIHRTEHFKQIIKHFIGFYGIYVFANASLLGLGGYLVLSQQLTLGQLVAAEIVLNALVYSFLRLCYHLRDLYALAASCKKINSVFELDYEPCVSNSSYRESTKFQVSPSIEFDNISYTNSLGESVIKDFSLSISSGEIICLIIIAKTKRNLVLDSLLGFNYTYQGNIRLNGNILTTKEKLLLRKKSYLIQDLEFIPGSLYENMTLNRQDVSKSQLNDMFSKLNILSDVESLPEGINSPILTHKIDLTHATLYKLSIIRAFLAQPILLILDEVLDNFKKHDIQLILKFLKEIDSKPTIIITSIDQANTDFFKRVVKV